MYAEIVSVENVLQLFIWKALNLYAFDYESKMFFIYFTILISILLTLCQYQYNIIKKIDFFLGLDTF